MDQPFRPICKVAQSAPIRVGIWEGRIDFNAVQMSDFQLVFFDEFIDKLLLFTFVEDRCMEFTDAGKLHRVPLEQIRVSVSVFYAFQVISREETCFA